MVVNAKNSKTFVIPFFNKTLPFLQPFVKTFEDYHTTILPFFYIIYKKLLYLRLPCYGSENQKNGSKL